MQLGAQVGGAHWGHSWALQVICRSRMSHTAEKEAFRNSLENRACKIPSAEHPQTAKKTGIHPPSQMGKAATNNHNHYQASKALVMTVLGYANLQPEPCSHMLGLLLAGGQNPHKPSAASKLWCDISAPPGQANAEGRTTRWASSWRRQESQSRAN